jgi:dTDP-4-dehydrorhamnose reductase
MPKIAVIGARGQLGAAIVCEFKRAAEVVPFDRRAFDITDADAVGSAIRSARPDVIVNCAAYNAVDAAEDCPVEALQTNAFAVRGLARLARQEGIVLVHYSSDFVFDGIAREPYAEDAPLNPRSVYATSKMLGEWFAADAPQAYVLRVESLFGRAPGGPSARGSVAAIVNALRAGVSARVFEDRTISPTYILDAARATRELVERRPASGVYHCVNSGLCTWLELAREAARLMNVEPRLEIVKVADVPLRAARPQYCALSNAKLARAGIAMPPWQDALRRFLGDDLSDELPDGEARRQAG